eukprot:17492-Heterococcus_DN1.PRE.1
MAAASQAALASNWLQYAAFKLIFYQLASLCAPETDMSSHTRSQDLRNSNKYASDDASTEQDAVATSCRCSIGHNQSLS